MEGHQNDELVEATQCEDHGGKSSDLRHQVLANLKSLDCLLASLRLELRECSTGADVETHIITMEHILEKSIEELRFVGDAVDVNEWKSEADSAYRKAYADYQDWRKMLTQQSVERSQVASQSNKPSVVTSASSESRGQENDERSAVDGFEPPEVVVSFGSSISTGPTGSADDDSTEEPATAHLTTVNPSLPDRESISCQDSGVAGESVVGDESVEDGSQTRYPWKTTICEHFGASRQAARDFLITLGSPYDVVREVGGEDGSELYLLLAMVDICSPMLKALLEFYRGRIPARDVERAACLLGQSIRTKMTAAKHGKGKSKEEARKAAEREYAHCDVDGPLSTATRTFGGGASASRINSGENEVQPFVRAAKIATDTFRKRTNPSSRKQWRTFAKVAPDVGAFVGTATVMLSVFRLQCLVDFGSVKELAIKHSICTREELDLLTVLVEQFIADDEISPDSLTCMEIFEGVLVPATRAGVPIEHITQARRLGSILMTTLGYEEFRERCAVGESAPWTALLSKCSEEELESFRSNLLKPHLSEIGKDAQRLRRESLRKAFCPLFVDSAADTLGLDEDYADALLAGLICSPLSSYRGDYKASFLWEARLHERTGDEGYYATKLEDVKEIAQGAFDSIEEFQKDHSFIDLTQDLRSRERSRGVFSIYLEYLTYLSDINEEEEEGEEEGED